MMIYYKLANELLDQLNLVLEGEDAGSLHDLLHECIEDINLDQLTSRYRFSENNSELGYDMDLVTDFVQAMKRTYPRPLDVQDFKFDAFGSVYRDLLVECVDKIVAREFRSPKGLSLTATSEHTFDVLVNDNVIATFSVYDAVRPGVLVFTEDLSKASDLINNSSDLMLVLKSISVLKRYQTGLAAAGQVKEVIKEVPVEVEKEVIKEVEKNFHSRDKKDLEALETFVVQFAEGEAYSKDIIAELYDTSDERRVFNILTTDEAHEPLGVLTLTEDEYILEYAMTNVALDAFVNSHPVLKASVNLVKLLIAE